MNLQRERWVLRTPDGKILVGQKQNYEWRKLEDVKDARIATYMSEKKAMRAAEGHGWNIDRLGIYAEHVTEIYLSDIKVKV
jgi:hypothetical protein